MSRTMQCLSVKYRAFSARLVFVRVRNDVAFRPRVKHSDESKFVGKDVDMNNNIGRSFPPRRSHKHSESKSDLLDLPVTPREEKITQKSFLVSRLKSRGINTYVDS